MIFLKTNLKKGSDVMSKKNENINEEVKNAEETAEDIRDTETKEETSKETEETKEATADDKIAELEASVADWKDKYQRLMAEFENARKRTAKEATQRYDMGAMGVLEKLLPVIDNFERGLEAVSEDEKDSAFVKGIEQIYKQMFEQKRFADVLEYMDQMLYSFQKTGKILSALQETRESFKEGNMKECIDKAIEHIIGGKTFDENGALEKEALEMIEEKYMCDKIVTMHVKIPAEIIKTPFY